MSNFMEDESKDFGIAIKAQIHPIFTAGLFTALETSQIDNGFTFQSLSLGNIGNIIE